MTEVRVVFRRMRRVGLVLLLLMLVQMGAGQTGATEPPTTSYINGYWFDGRHFTRRTVYVVGESFALRRPKHVDSTVDLNGGYVVPAFGEAHNHNVEPLNDIKKLVATYLEHGIFYVKDPDNLPRDRAAVAAAINRPDSIDVIFSNGGWTSTGGHPAEIVKRNVDRKRWADADGEGAFYWTAASPAEVGQKWLAYVQQGPQFVKVYLLFAADAKRQAEAARYFGRKGVTPEVLAAIVQRAHAEHLRVTAHIESARDFHDALIAGVDEIGHMPGFRMFADVDPHSRSEFEISGADAELAHQRGAVVVTTLVGATTLRGSQRAEQDALNALNLRRLLAHRVRLALGSDSYRQDTLAEAQYIDSLHVIARAVLLRMWAETTPEIIFFPSGGSDNSNRVTRQALSCWLAIRCATSPT
jgi:hypothetical protein